MAGEYRAPCGCTVHVIQWTSKKKVVTQKSCSLHLAASSYKEALERIMAVASGEEQVSTYKGEPLLADDTGGMQWIYFYSRDVLAAAEQRPLHREAAK